MKVSNQAKKRDVTYNPTSCFYLDGIEVLEAIKTVGSRAVVLIITGYGTFETEVAAIKAGAYDFICRAI